MTIAITSIKRGSAEDLSSPAITSRVESGEPGEARPGGRLIRYPTRGASLTRSREVTLRFLAEPVHVNFGGKVHGGAVMKWIDQAGYACAAAWTGDYCVTVYVGGIHFIRPIRVGDLVELRALVIHTGKTSIHVAVDLYCRDPRGTDRHRAGHCVIVFVALDTQGRPKPVTPWVPQTEVDRALEGYANRLKELSRLMDSEMEARLKLLDVLP